MLASPYASRWKHGGGPVTSSVSVHFLLVRAIFSAYTASRSSRISSADCANPQRQANPIWLLRSFRNRREDGDVRSVGASWQGPLLAMPNPR